MQFQSNDQTEDFEKVMLSINIVFTSLFTMESVLKIIGFGFKNYFKDSWNTFDFITVIGSIVDAVISVYTVSFSNEF